MTAECTRCGQPIELRAIRTLTGSMDRWVRADSVRIGCPAANFAAYCLPAVAATR